MISAKTNNHDAALSKEHPDLIIEGGMLLTMVEGEEPIPGSTVHVTDGRIARILRAGE
ncbi:MAG: hypothetical protein HQ561_13945, partial [Desulfobacteraceae bacterium]|nr:hypothetical protein [Desulfobacteraceae bacterium]